MAEQGDNTFAFKSRNDCPDRKRLHGDLDAPSGYGPFFEWMEEKAKTHRQERCPTCRYWCAWRPKRRAATSTTDAERTPCSSVSGAGSGGEQQ